MTDRFFPGGGTPAPPEDLREVKARDLALRLAAEEIPHATLVECRRSESADVVVFDVWVEVPNRRVHQIRRRERLAASFHAGDGRVPTVEALRRDFPVVPHLNLHLQEFPRSLCLYVRRYEELKLEWTAPRFVHRVREWLRLTARGELHQEDQRLEPLLVDYSGHIVLPLDLLQDPPEQLHVTAAPRRAGRWFLKAHRLRPAGERKSLPVVLRIYTCQPHTHGVMHRRPTTLEQVAGIAQVAGLDLATELRRALKGWIEDSQDSHVALVLIFPKTRSEGGPVEDHDVWCFVTTQTVGELGVELGLWEDRQGSLAWLIEPDVKMQGRGAPVEVLNPCFELTRDSAARMNGKPGANDLKVVGVGVGALGSQVVMNMARAGFGRWTLVDPDCLMPHNVARHALDGTFVGRSKAQAVAACASKIASGEGVFEGLDADILRPGDRSEEVERALSSADAIVDLTAAVAAQRHLARSAASPARRLCVFLSPSGADLVVLAEDSDRLAYLDALEMQYYRALLHDPGLAGHLEQPVGRQRYARSCGDVTSEMPQDFVALHAAIASRNLKEILSVDAPFIGVWRAGSSCDVRHQAVEVRPVVELTLDSWTVVFDEGLRERLSQLSLERLPNETGGALLGSFDLDRKILYIVDTLPSPPDSEERTDLYIRGSIGLRADMAEAEEKTGGMLEYVGEWHSHPPNADTRPSLLDLEVFEWLRDLMSTDGLPAVMMIVGHAEMSLFVGTIGNKASPIPERPRGEDLA